jgi:hypothetical protein
LGSETSISLTFIIPTADGPQHVEQNITGAKFKEMCGDLLDRCQLSKVRAPEDVTLILKDMNESSWPMEPLETRPGTPSPHPIWHVLADPHLLMNTALEL